MRIIVTGAAGFVGSQCVDALSQMKADDLGGLEIVAACRDQTNAPVWDSVEFIEGDLRDQMYLENLMKNADIVIHAAAWSSLFRNEENSRQYFLEPSLDVLAAAKRFGVHRFVLISSTSVAAPENSSDAMSPGLLRSYWPHEANLVRIENAVREAADDNFCGINLRIGLFAGARYGLGLLPILAPRLKTHLVPWVNGGKTSMPIIDGKDIGQAAALCATNSQLGGYNAFNVAGPEIPSVREVLTYLNKSHQLPLPHFSVPFPLAFTFAWLMEFIDPIVPWEPLVTRSIIHLLQETNLSNDKAEHILGYKPQHHWKNAIDLQMSQRQKEPMALAKNIQSRLS